jgi:tetratricopeptide (TPR) repeat protein
MLKDPKTGADYNARGLSLHNKGRYDEAIKDFTRALSLGPEKAVYLTHRGMAYNDKKEYGRALSDLNEAIKIDPGLAAAYVCRGYSYMHKGEADKARADWDKAIELDPDGKMAYKNRAVYFLLTDNYDAALADLLKSRPPGGGGLPDDKMYVRTLLGKGDYHSALLAVYDRMMRKGGVDYAELCWIYYAKEGFTARTRKYCVKTRDLTGWFVFGSVGDKERAAEYYRKAPAAGRKRAAFYLRLGDHYNSRRELPQALWAYKKAAECDKDDFEARVRLSLPKFKSVKPQPPEWASWEK